MESQSLEPQNMPTESVTPEEIRHVPLWVKGMVGSGVLLFLIQIPTFTSSLSEAIHKSQASAAYDKGQYLQAVEKYKELHAHYPGDKELTKNLGFALYKAGQYIETLDAFDQLVGVKMTKEEIEEINTAISDAAAKLNLKTK